MVAKRHLLLTNDFPPKIGGIQSYLWELWRRLDPESFVVYTSNYPGAHRFDTEQEFEIIRSKSRWLGPFPHVVRAVKDICERLNIERVLIDPAWPLASIGPRLGVPYGVILHGAEVKVPASIWGLSAALRKALLGSSLVVAAGTYPLEVANTVVPRLPGVIVAPGVDSEVFVPVTAQEKSEIRSELGLKPDAFVVSAVSRLVKRKGFDTLVKASAQLSGEAKLSVLIGGKGRDRNRLERLIDKYDAPVTLLGRLDQEQLIRLYQASDVMAMLCKKRWFGLEQEGFGIVFLEAAACGVPQLGGRSGGSHEPILDGETGLIVDNPHSVQETVRALRSLIFGPDTVKAMGEEARRQALRFDYDKAARKLAVALETW